MRADVRRTHAVIAVSLLLAGGCSDDVDESDHQAAGFRLDQVLVVPRGTELVGTVFPAANEGDWDAVLVMTQDDPFVIVQDLVDQAEEAGYDVSSQRTDGRACAVLRGSVLECSTFASRDGAPESYGVSLRWGNLEGASFRHVLVRRRSHGIWRPPNLTSIEADLPAPPAPIADWHEPEVGDPVAAPPAAFDESIVVLEAGGRVIDPPAHAWSGTGGYHVVVALDDDVDAEDVIAAYAAQFEDLRFGGTISESTFEGRLAVAARYTAGGGGQIEAVVVDGADSQRSFLLLSRADD